MVLHGLRRGVTAWMGVGGVFVEIHPCCARVAIFRASELLANLKGVSGSKAEPLMEQVSEGNRANRASPG